MPDNQDSVNRRDFMVKTAAVAGALGAAKELFAKPAKAALMRMRPREKNRIRCRLSNRICSGRFSVTERRCLDSTPSPRRC